MRTLLLFVIILCATGCTLTEPPESSVDLRDRLEEVRLSQIAAVTLWDRVIFGESVSCQDAIPVPSPVILDHPTDQQQAAQDKINEAIQLLRESAALWDGECGESDQIVPISTARDGRAGAVSAGERLDEASELIN